MSRPWFQLLCVVALSLAAQNAFAHEKVYNFFIDGATEIPPNASPGTGFARATFDLDLVTMRIQASFQDLLGNTTAAHIHCCDFQPSGAAGVATQTPFFAGFPIGVTSGTYDHTFDMTLASSYRAQFLTANGGSVSNALNSLLAGLDSGKAYFNIHTNLFQPGEIRGLAVPVPEPTSAVLCVLGLLLPLGFVRKTR
jgi:CHRD domain-containing protein